MCGRIRLSAISADTSNRSRNSATVISSAIASYLPPTISSRPEINASLVACPIVAVSSTS